MDTCKYMYMYFVTRAVDIYNALTRDSGNESLMDTSINTTVLLTTQMDSVDYTCRYHTIV